MVFVFVLFVLFPS